MLDVVQGLRAAEAEARRTGDTALGLDNCTVTVAFNVTAGGTDRNQLVLDASIKPPARVVDAGLTAQATVENTLAASRGNVITVLLTSPACYPPDTLGTLRPSQVSTLAEQGKRVRDRKGDGPLTTYGGRLTRRQNEALRRLLDELGRR